MRSDLVRPWKEIFLSFVDIPSHFVCHIHHTKYGWYIVGDYWEVHVNY